MTNEELAYQIAKGIGETEVEGKYRSVSCSTAGDYPSIGCSQWEGLGGRGDALLSMIDGGAQFAGRTYSDIEANEGTDALSAVLDSPSGREAQNQTLAQDCLESYVPALLEVPGLTNPACIIYAGIWCPTNHDLVRRFLTRRVERGYDVNDLDTIKTLFYEQYAAAAGCEDYAEGYQNRAVNTGDYVAALGVA